MVVAAGIVDEADAGVIGSGEEGAGRIGVVGAADHGVLGEEVAGIEGVEGGQGVAVEAAAAEGDVVGEDKILEGGAAAAEDVHAVEDVGMGDEDRVVIDGDITEAGAGGGGGVMEHALHAPGDIGEGADVEKEVVLEEDALEGLSGAVVVSAHVGIPGRGAVDDVVGDGDIRDDMPGAAAAGAGGEGDAGAGVGLEVVVPGVFQDVAVEQDAGGVFEFEEILDRPGGQAGVGVVGIVPGGRFEEMVAADLDVGRDDAVRGILGEHDVLAGGLDLIIDDLKGAGAAVAQDAVGLVTEFMDVGDPGIEDGGGGAVDDDAVAEAAGGGAVDVAAVEDEVSGGGAAIEIDDGVGRAAGGGPGGGELDAGEAVVMGSSRRGNGGIRIATDDLGHEGSLGGGDAGAGGGKAAQGGGQDVDPPGPGLIGEGEVAGVGGAGGEDDDAIGLGGVEGGLEVATGRDGDGGAGGEGVGGIQVDARQLGQHGRVGGPQERSPWGHHHRGDQQRGQKHSCKSVTNCSKKHGGLLGAEDRQFRTPSSVARPSGSSPDPWFCVPASRRVCPCRKGVSPRFPPENTGLCPSRHRVNYSNDRETGVRHRTFRRVQLGRYQQASWSRPGNVGSQLGLAPALQGEKLNDICAGLTPGVARRWEKGDP